MTLNDLMHFSTGRDKIRQDVTEERVKNQLDNLRNLIAFFREYPDIFVDFIKGEDCHFKFYFYQRVFLRVAMRHRYTYATFPRGFSKSFLSILILILRCVLFPGSHLFVTATGKEQAASITIAKVKEICDKIPALNNEINWGRGQSKTNKTDVQCIFKNGSVIDVLAVSERSRGQRRNGGVMEECASMDQDKLNEIIIPTTNIDRELPDGSRHPEEVVNKSQVYITTAGYKNSFAFDKLIELLIQSIIEPDQAMIMGGSYEIPVKEGAQDKDFIEQLKMQDTYTEDSFDREYCSKWTGDIDGAFFSSNKIDRCRTIMLPEYESSAKRSKDAFYVIGVDVGRLGCSTEACVFKVAPQTTGTPIKSLVNIYSREAEHFEEQAIFIKRLYYAYDARVVALDANGMGIGLVDYLVKPQYDAEMGETLPPFGVMNDDEGIYKKFKTFDTEIDALYLIKANAAFNTEAYSYAQAQLSAGKIKLLIDEKSAKERLMATKRGQDMNADERAEYLMPFVATNALKEQLLNLVLKSGSTNINIILDQSSRRIPKDKVSAFIYGLYWIKQDENNARRRHGHSFLDCMFFS